MSRIKQKQSLKLWFGLIVLILVLLGWVKQTVKSTQISYEISRVEEGIKFEERRKIELKREQDRVLALESLELFARNKLGLVEPQKENIILIKVEK